MELRIIGIPGSLRKGSYTHKAMQVVLKSVQEFGATVELINLYDYTFPFCQQYAPGKLPEKMEASISHFSSKLKNAHGIILGTPEYHGNMSGVLKNALDLVGFDEFRNKVVGLLGVSGGALGGTNALTALRVVVRTLYAWVIPQQVSISYVSGKFDNEGNCTDSGIQTRLEAMGKHMVEATFHHNSDHIHEIMDKWKKEML